MVRRVFLFFLCSQFILIGATAQQAPRTSQAPGVAVANPTGTIIDEFRKTVGFLRVTYLDGVQLRQITGTCFFVSYADKRLRDGQSFGYLVTNRHMAIPGAEKGLSYPVQQVFLRVNLRSAEGETESVEEPIPLGGNIHWFVPDDEAVDLAVLPVHPDDVKVDYAPIDSSTLATKDAIEAAKIDTGDHVIFAGFFYQFPGEKKIQPIVREGVLAMMPEEELKTTLQKPGHLYLADVHVFHGNSGSPLLVNLGGFRGSTNVVTLPNYLLLGVISGYYPEDERFSLPAATVLTGEVHDNSGIATIVPAYELKLLLDSPALQAARNAAVTSEAGHSQP